MAETDSTKRHTVSTPLSKDEYLAKASGPQVGFEGTIDGVDRNRGATVQTAVLDPEKGENDYAGLAVGNPLNETPGQVFETWQLPDPQAAIDAGLPPVLVPEHLIVGDEALYPEQGPEPLDVLNKEARERLGNPSLDRAGYVVTGPVAAGLVDPTSGDDPDLDADLNSPPDPSDDPSNPPITT